MIITLPNGAKYAPNDKALVETLFTPGGTASGTYKRLKGGIRFYDAQGNPFLFLVCNRHGERFFVSCSKIDGKVWYMYGVSTATEKATGLDTLGYIAQHDFAESIAKQVGK